MLAAPSGSPAADGYDCPGIFTRGRRRSMKSTSIPVTLIPGDGIGPEVVTAARRIIEATGAPVAWDEQRAGADVFREGLPSGVPDETIASISETRVALKGPLETPVGFGEKSANVTPQAVRDLRERAAGP